MSAVLPATILILKCLVISLSAIILKKEIIPWSWEFVTKELGIPADKLWITIHTEDDEAFDIWHNVVGLPEERIVRLEENFWEIGSGPCGPCSEIHVDLG